MMQASERPTCDTSNKFDITDLLFYVLYTYRDSECALS